VVHDADSLDATRVLLGSSTSGIAHGASEINRDRMLISSDPFYCHLCPRCGQQAVANLKEQLFYCGACKTDTTIRQVFMCYAAKQFFQLLPLIGVTPSLQVVDVLN